MHLPGTDRRSEKEKGEIMPGFKDLIKNLFKGGNGGAPQPQAQPQPQRQPVLTEEERIEAQKRFILSKVKEQKKKRLMAMRHQAIGKKNSAQLRQQINQQMAEIDSITDYDQFRTKYPDQKQYMDGFFFRMTGKKYPPKPQAKQPAGNRGAAKKIPPKPQGGQVNDQIPQKQPPQGMNVGPKPQGEGVNQQIPQKPVPPILQPYQQLIDQKPVIPGARKKPKGVFGAGKGPKEPVNQVIPKKPLPKIDEEDEEDDLQFEVNGVKIELDLDDEINPPPQLELNEIQPPLIDNPPPPEQENIVPPPQQEIVVPPPEEELEEEIQPLLMDEPLVQQDEMKINDLYADVKDIDFQSSLYEVITGKKKRYNEVFMSHLQKSGEKRKAFSRMANEIFQKEAESFDDAKAHKVREKIKALDALRKDPTGVMRAKELLNMDLSLFFEWDDEHLINNYEGLNRVIKFAKEVKETAYPLIEENGGLTQEEDTNLIAIINAIEEYDKYLVARLTLIANPYYALGFDEAIFESLDEELPEQREDESDEDYDIRVAFAKEEQKAARQQRASDLEANANLSTKQLSFLMRAVSFKEALEDTSFASEDFSFNKLLKSFGYVGKISGTDIEIKEDVELDPELQVQRGFINQLNEEQRRRMRILQGHEDEDEDEDDEEEEIHEEEVVPPQQEPPKPPLQVIVGANAPETPATRIQKIHKIVSGSEAPMGEDDLKRITDKSGRRADIVELARDNLVEYNRIDRNAAARDIKGIVHRLKLKGYSVAPEVEKLMELLALVPGSVPGARQQNKSLVESYATKGSIPDKGKTFYKAIHEFMTMDFAAFNLVDDQAILYNYAEICRIDEVGFQIEDMMDQAIKSRYCYISQDRADNFYYMFSEIHKVKKYADKVMVYHLNPLYALIDVEEEISEQNEAELVERLKKQHPANEQDLYGFVQLGLDLSKARAELGRGNFMERITQSGFKAVEQYEDQKPEMQEAFRQAINVEFIDELPNFVPVDEDEERRIQGMNDAYVQGDLYSKLQQMVGRDKVHRDVKKTDEYKMQAQQRRYLTSRIDKVKDAIRNININGDPNMPLDEILNINLSFVDCIAEGDDALIDNFNLLYAICKYGRSADEKLKVYSDPDNADMLKPETKVKLVAIRNMMRDMEQFLLLKLKQIGNPYYQHMHTDGDYLGEEFDLAKADEIAKNYKVGGPDDAAYLINVNMLLHSDFRVNFKTDGKTTMMGYLQRATQDEDALTAERLNEEFTGVGRKMAAVEYLFDGHDETVEHLGDVDMQPLLRSGFEKNAAFRRGVGERAKISLDMKEYNYQQKLAALKKAAGRLLKEFPMIELKDDQNLINSAYDRIDVGDDEESVKRNMDLLLNLFSPDNNVRSKMYKDLVDGFLKMDLSVYDNTSDEYLINHYPDLVTLSVPAVNFSLEETYDTMIKSGYQISDKKKNNAMAQAKAIRDYMTIADHRMKLIAHPYYQLLYRVEDEERTFDTAVLEKRLSKISRYSEGPLMEYLLLLSRAMLRKYSPESKKMRMVERMTKGYGYEADAVYEEDDANSASYQKGLADAKKETYAARVEQKESLFVNYILTGKVQTLAEFEQQKSPNAVQARTQLRELAHNLPAYEDVPPVLLGEAQGDDLSPSDKQLSRLEYFMKEPITILDDLTDAKILQNFEGLVVLCKAAEQAKHELELYKTDDRKKPLPDDIPFDSFYNKVEGRIHLLEDLGKFLALKRSHFSHPNFIADYSEESYKGAATKESMEERAKSSNSAGELNIPEYQEFERLSREIKSCGFLKNYTGNGQSTEAVYYDADFLKRTQLVNPGDKFVFKGEGEKIEHLDADGKPIKDGEAQKEQEPKQPEEPPEQEPLHSSKSMDGPLSELLNLCAWLQDCNSNGFNWWVNKVVKQKKYVLEEGDRVETDEQGIKHRYDKFGKEHPLKSKKQRVVFNTVERKYASKKVREELQPIIDELLLIQKDLGAPLTTQDSMIQDQQMWSLLQKFTLLGGLCDQYLTGRQFRGHDVVETQVRRKVRRLRSIAEYAYTQTYTSVRMARIYFDKVGIKHLQIPFQDVYFYAEQDFPGSTALTVYDRKIDPGMIATAKGEKIKEKDFGADVNDFTKVEHWIDIFEDRKPDEIEAANRPEDVKEMDRLIRLMRTTNKRADQVLPSDSADFENACADMMHSFRVVVIRCKRFLSNSKGEGANDKKQRDMLERIIASYNSQMSLFDRYRGVIPDTYEKVKEDSHARTVSDIFHAWYRDSADFMIRQMHAKRFVKVTADTGVE